MIINRKRRLITGPAKWHELINPNGNISTTFDISATDIFVSCVLLLFFFWDQSYKWDKNEVVVQWIEEQLSKASNESIINRNIYAVKKDAVINQIKCSLEVSFLFRYVDLFPIVWYFFPQDCPDVAFDAIVAIIEKLNDNQKAEVIRTLSQLGSLENID